MILISLSFFVISCSSKNEINSAKQELLSEDTPQEVISQVDNLREIDKEIEETQSTSLVQIIALDGNSPLSFDEISESSVTSWEVIISWTAWNDVDKIEVFFTNPNSTYSDDRYILQTYVKWEWDFKYIASSKNKVLDFGINEYIFRAYSGIAENETKVIINVPTDTAPREWEGSQQQLIGWEDDTLLIDLPTSTKYGEPLLLWEDSFTYTQIKWLEIQKQILTEVMCENLTEYLSEKMNVWYYWNTCRDIVSGEGIKFNLIRLEWDTYVYERHYINYTQGLYWVYELESGQWVGSENIADKNDELKDADFPTIEIVDDLIKDITNA